MTRSESSDVASAGTYVASRPSKHRDLLASPAPAPSLPTKNRRNVEKATRRTDSESIDRLFSIACLFVYRQLHSLVYIYIYVRCYKLLIALRKNKSRFSIMRNVNNHIWTKLFQYRRGLSTMSKFPISSFVLDDLKKTRPREPWKHLVICHAHPDLLESS